MIPKRIAESIEKWFQKDYRATFYERIEYLLESRELFEDLPYAIRYGRTLQYILDNISVFIQPEEKIIGYVKEIIPSEEQKEVAEKLSDEWWNLDLETIQEKILWFYSYGWLKRRPPWFYSFGHLALQWDEIINKGLLSLRSKAVEKLNDFEVIRDQNKHDFIQGTIICYDAQIEYIKRYAREAESLAALCQDESRKNELMQIGKSCSHISEKPARSFWEALQLMWLIILPLQKVAGCGVLNFSRMDQYLYPLYKRDVENGVLSKEEALELIIEFYNKNNDIMSPTDHMSQESETTQYSIEVAYDDPNYITLAGKRDDGSPGVNELSYLFVEAAHKLKLRNPYIVVRYYNGIESNFWKQTCEAVRDNATVVIYNDETMIPALISYGVDELDVYDYGFYGCNDPNIPGKEGGLRQMWFNLLRPLELALNSGNYPMEPDREKVGIKGVQGSLEDRMIGLMSGPYYGVETLNPDKIKNINELLECYRLQLRHLLEGYREGFEKDFGVEKRHNAGRMRIEDCFLEGTIENAITWNDGGTKYHKLLIQGGGVASVVDSLAAIEEVVFKNKEYTLCELVEILNRNYVGHEFLQKRLVNKMPKFGNDIKWVDDLARMVVDIFCDEVMRVNSTDYLYSFFPTLSTDRDFTGEGAGVGATPDGRMAKAPISENQSPTIGKDKNGLTALFNSLSTVPFNRVTGGPLNIKLHPSAVKGDIGLDAFASAVETYMRNGGLQIQVNVVSKEELLDAQQHPEKYSDLCVRVTGYSAYFVQMGRKAQDELIARSELK